MEGYHGYATPQSKIYSAGGGIFGSGGILGTGITAGTFDALLNPTARREKFDQEPQVVRQEDEGPDTTTVIVLVFAGLLVLGGTGFLTYKLSS
jgi:hypothetical protein